MVKTILKQIAKLLKYLVFLTQKTILNSLINIKGNQGVIANHVTKIMGIIKLALFIKLNYATNQTDLPLNNNNTSVRKL